MLFPLFVSYSARARGICLSGSRRYGDGATLGCPSPPRRHARGVRRSRIVCVHLYRCVHERAPLSAAPLGLYHRGGIFLHMRIRSVGTNDRILKVPAVQAPNRAGSHRGFLFRRIAKRIEDHKSATPLTGHVDFSWSSSPVFSITHHIRIGCDQTATNFDARGSAELLWDVPYEFTKGLGSTKRSSNEIG